MAPWQLLAALVGLFLWRQRTTEERRAKSPQGPRDVPVTPAVKTTPKDAVPAEYVDAAGPTLKALGVADSTARIVGRYDPVRLVYVSPGGCIVAALPRSKGIPSGWTAFPALNAPVLMPQKDEPAKLTTYLIHAPKDFRWVAQTGPACFVPGTYTGGPFSVPGALRQMSQGFTTLAKQAGTDVSKLLTNPALAGVVGFADVIAGQFGIPLKDVWQAAADGAKAIGMDPGPQRECWASPRTRAKS